MAGQIRSPAKIAAGVKTRAEKKVANRAAVDATRKPAAKKVVPRQRKVGVAETPKITVTGGTTRPGARTFTDTEVAVALDMVALEGMSLKEACAELSLVYSTVLTRIRNSADLTALDTRARQQYVRTKAREMNALVDETPDVQVARLKCDNIKWEAARVLPKEYGDRIQLAGDPEAPLVTAQLPSDPIAAAAAYKKIMKGE